MRLTFRQGLVGAPAPASFLNINGGNGIDLIVGQIPVLATAAFSTSDYLIGEYASVTNAWGPFPIGPTTRYLYWQINEATGAVSRGSTTLPLIQSPAMPLGPAVGQTWWNSSNDTMFIWTGVVWQTTILVFAATLLSGAILEYFGGFGPGYSQVGINDVEIDAGFVLTDGFGGVFRDNDGFLLTTETNLISNDTGSQVKIDGALVVVQAGQNLPAFTLVYLLNGRAVPASSDPSVYQAEAPIAMVTDPTPQSAAVALVTAGRMVINTAWSWLVSQFGMPVYCDIAGNVTLTKPPTLKYVRVGTIVGINNIL